MQVQRRRGGGRRGQAAGPAGGGGIIMRWCACLMDLCQDGWPHVRNNNPAYKMLMHRLDEMNDYKNRLRAEIEH